MENGLSRFKQSPRFQKARKALSSHWVFFASLIWIYGYNFAICGFRPWKTDLTTFSFYAVDYSFGFCTKFLPGAFYNLFTKAVSFRKVDLFCNVLLLLAMCSVCLMLDRFYNGVPSEYKKTVLVVYLFFLAGTGGFSMLFKDFGLLDGFWIYFAILIVFFLRYRVLRPLLPVFFFLCLLTHLGAAITYVPFFAILILYELSLCEKKSQKWVLRVVFVVSLLVTAATVLYFFRNDRSNLRFSSARELRSALYRRGADGAYYCYVFFDDYSSYLVEPPDPLITLSGTFLPAQVEQVLNTVFRQIALTFELYKSRNYKSFWIEGCTILVLAPAAVCLYKVLAFQFKRAKGSVVKRAAVFFCMCLAPFTSITAFFLSIDVRWIFHAYLMLFSAVLYMTYREKEALLPQLRTVVSKPRPVFLILYYLVYAAVVFRPYSF